MLQPALGVAASAEAAAESRKRARAARRSLYDDEGPFGRGEEQEEEQAAEGREPPTWQAALGKGGGPFAVPITPEDAAAANDPGAGAPSGGGAGAAPGAAAAAEPGPGGPGVTWSYPATQEERHRYWVFRDLHRQG